MFVNNKRIIPNPENDAKVKLSTHLYSYSTQFCWEAILRMSQNTKMLSISAKKLEYLRDNGRPFCAKSQFSHLLKLLYRFLVSGNERRV